MIVINFSSKLVIWVECIKTNALAQLTLRKEVLPTSTLQKVVEVQIILPIEELIESN